MILFRPVGAKELELIKAAGYKKFPPRLPQQPLFYPVLNIEYARQIAKDWNTKDAASAYKGYVLRFEVDDEFIRKYPEHCVGADIHRELWIPAEELESFNRHIIGSIEVVEKYP